MPVNNGYSWGERSSKLIQHVHPRGQLVLSHWMRLLNETEGAPDVRLVETARSRKQALENAAKGIGSANSKHIPRTDGYCRAWDFQIVGPNPYDRDLIRRAVSLMLRAADEMGIPCRSGGDWDMDGIPVEKDASERGQLADHVHGEMLDSTELRYKEWPAARDRRKKAREAGEAWPL
ncbi:hedgehog signaling/dD-peptidase zinc-binding domain protein [Caudoviricetes sp.]|nr:hedgehog signaling/dD-peptidase zinc-binding domain protein [Caudoviricetes sp.]